MTAIRSGEAPVPSSARCRRNALRMFHCAPTVLQTLLEERDRQEPELVKEAGALAGGIGGPGECGGVCGSLMMLGLLHGDERGSTGVPRVVPLGQEYLRRFGRLHGSVLCSEIGPRGMGACMRAICTSPALLAQVCAREEELQAALPAEVGAGHRKVLSQLERGGFHCAHRVLDELRDEVPVTQEMRRASWGFLGGMVLSGGTCGALAAGVMAVGAKLGGIERSTLRTLRMIATLLFSEERAMADDLNASNRAIRVARALARRFRERHLSTRCAELTGVDFASPEAAGRFGPGGVERCAAIALGVAADVKELCDEEERPGPGRPARAPAATVSGGA